MPICVCTSVCVGVCNVCTDHVCCGGRHVYRPRVRVATGDSARSITWAFVLDGECVVVGQ